MNIVHVAPFAPCRCGLYEAAADMARADIITGHNVYFVDSGITINNNREQPVIGAIDDRAGFRVTTAHPDVIKKCDIVVLHTGVPDEWIKDKPLVWVIHARPLAAFRPEQNNGMKSYSIYAQVSKWQQTKKMVYFWKEFEPYWKVIVPYNKLHLIDFPPIDLNRFNPQGEKHKSNDLGIYNGLICDSWREDIDVYEIVNGAIEAARIIPGLKWHLYALEHPIPECWKYLISELKSLNALGEIRGRMTGLEYVYRAFDFLLTPHRIVTRTIGEALSCGMPVIASNGCRVAQETTDIQNPYDVAKAVQRMINGLEKHRESSLKESEKFNLINFGMQMNNLYRGVVNV
ncbi:MAG: hypothetical protein ACFFDF_00390 [Candidatus Odinarchaeota archaeon]